MDERWRRRFLHEVNAARLDRRSRIVEVIEEAPTALDRTAATVFWCLGERSPDRLAAGLAQCIRHVALVNPTDAIHAERWVWSTFHRVAPRVAYGAPVGSIRELLEATRPASALSAEWQVLAHLGRSRLARQVGYAMVKRARDRADLLRLYMEDLAGTGDELAQLVTPAAALVEDARLEQLRVQLAGASPVLASQACTALAATRDDVDLATVLYRDAVALTSNITDHRTRVDALLNLGRVLPVNLIPEFKQIAAAVPLDVVPSIDNLLWHRFDRPLSGVDRTLAWSGVRDIDSDPPAAVGAEIHGEAVDAVWLTAIGPPDPQEAMVDVRRHLAMASNDERSYETPTFVSTGFSTLAEPSVPSQRSRPLDRSTDYYFWLSIGELVDGSIDVEPTEIDLSSVEVGGQLDVVAYARSGIEIPADSRHGVLELRADGSVRVQTQPGATNASLQRVSDRVLFPVATGEEPAIGRLRCSILHKGVVLQSRVVTVPVGIGKDGPKTLLDYELVERLDPAALEGLARHDLSLMTNSENGSHDFHFWLQDGDQVIAEAVSIEAGEAGQMIDAVREGLRTASWGTPNVWNHEADLYGGAADIARLQHDLRQLACAGFRLWDQIANRLSRRGRQVLSDVMRAPGRIQLAPKFATEIVLPLAAFYDYPLDPAIGDRLHPCEEAFAAIGSADGFDLRQHTCFQGLCPNYGDHTIFCPGGFWGYRHAIGIPLPAHRPGATSIAAVTSEGGPIRPALCVSTDQRLTTREHHIQELIDRLQPRSVPDPLRVLSTRTAVLEALRDERPHLAYFFCHGDVNGGIPRLHVGDESEPPIERATIGVNRIDWSDDPSPLVFLNGCETAGIDPLHTITLAGGFIEAGAAGVIGTDITVFDTMAARFAEAFVPAFLEPDGQIGESLRQARLGVLQDRCNPLGLVYAAYAVASLRLSRRPGDSSQEVLD